MPDSPQLQGELLVENLQVKFGGVVALSDLSFMTAPGSLMAIVGPNGAGKTTLLNAISGIHRRTARGRISLDGKGLLSMRPARVAKAGVGRSFQDPPLVDKLSALENVLVGSHLELNYGMLRQILPRGGAYLRERASRDQAIEALASMGLDRYASQAVGSLSYGVRKLLDIVRASLLRPRLLLLDEPTSGLDAEGQGIVEDLIRDLRRRFPMTILMVEHHMDRVRALADSVLNIQAGRVVMIGHPEDILGSEDFRRSMTGENR